MATPEIGIKISAQGVAQAQQQLAGLQGTIAGIGTAAASLRGALAGLTGAFTVAGVAGWVRAHVDAMDAMNDLADATGASIEELSKLDQVARRNGQSLDQVGGILVKFNAALKEADGKNAVSRALQAIGLDAQRLRELDPAEALRQTAVALQGYANDGNKARVVQELFGKSIREAAPFLKDLAEAGELNAKVTAEQAQAAEAFNKSMFGLTANAQDAGRQFASVLLPTLQEIVTAFSEGQDGASRMAEAAQALLVPIQALAVLGANVAFVFRQLGEEIGGQVAKAQALATLDWRAWLRIRAERERDAESARAQLDAFERRVMEVDARAKATQQQRRQEDRGFNPTAKQVGDLGALQQAAKAASSAFDDLQAAIDRARTAAEADAEAGGKMSDARKLQIELIDRFTRKTGELTDAQRRSVAAGINQAVATRAVAEAEKQAMEEAEKAARARSEARQAEQRVIDDFEQSQQAARRAALQSVKDRIQSLDDEEAAVALSRSANISLAEAIEQVAIARLREKQYREGSEPYLDVQREIEARQRLLQVISGAETRKASEAAAEQALREWQRATEQIEQSLTDALMSGGKSGAEYIRGLFRAMVLRPVIQAVVQPYAQAVAGSMGGFGASGSLSGGPIGYGLDALATSRIGQRLGLSSLQEDAAGNIFSAPSAGTQAVASYAKSLGAALSYADAFMAAKGGRWGEAIGQGFGTAIGGPVGGQIGKMLGAAIDKAFRGNAGTPHMGGYYALDYSGRVNTAYGMGESNRSAELDSIVGGLVRPVNDALNSLLRGFSLPGNFQTGATFKSDGKDGSYGIIQLDRSTGGSVSKRADGTLPADAKAGFEEFSKLAASAMLEALDAIDLPAWASRVLDSIASDATTDEVIAAIQGINATQTAIVKLSDAIRPLDASLAALANAGGDYLQALAGLSGGFEALTNNLGSYYDAFFSESERAAAESARIAAALGEVGLALPKTRADFRALVDAQIALGDAGQPALAALLGVAASFAELTPAAEETAAAVRSAQDVLRERQGLERQLLELTGDTARLRALELEELDPTNRALLQRIYALRDEQEAQQKVAAAAEKAAQLASAASARLSQAIDSALQQALSPQAMAQLQYRRASERLAGAGVQASAEQLAAASVQQVVDFAAAFVRLQSVSDDAKAAVVEVAGSLVTLAQQAQRTTAEALQGRISAIVAQFGDVEAALAPKTETLADAYRRAATEIDGLQSALDEFVGDVQRSVIDGLRDLAAQRRSIADFRAGLSQQIDTARLTSMQPTARIAALRAREATLSAQLGSAADPVAVAQRLTQTVTARIAEQARLSSKVYGDQIDALTRLRDLSADIRDYVKSLSIGDLSPLSPAGRLDAARAAFSQSAVGAAAGDERAQRNLVSDARTYLEQLREMFASSEAYARAFADVQDRLTAVASAGEAVDPQLSALQALQESVSSGSDETVATLSSIDAALAQRDQEIAARSEQQIQLARDQLAELRAANAAREDQLRVQAGIIAGLRTQIERLVGTVDSIAGVIEREGARP